MGKEKRTNSKKGTKDPGIFKVQALRKGRSVKAGGDEIEDIFSNKNTMDSSEIDDIFNTKSIKEDETAKKKEPVVSKSAKRKAAKKSKLVVEEKVEEEMEEDEEEGEEEEMTEEQVRKVEEVVFAELAAVKNTLTPQKRAAPPPTFDDDFADSKGIKKTNRTTDDGYPLYDVKDLNIGNGLDTPECPFDCKCCRLLKLLQDYFVAQRAY
ncbi:hypothetical protein MFLAVUS_009697 [Mucor flavus]|uniref:DUF1764-domain-containing protein n=1 Tax=Mucor flavus TaxID=439312 RepID=A0ABP9ZAQ5_9FUNG